MNENLVMEVNQSPNQSGSALQDVKTSQSQISSDITNLLEGNTSNQHIIAEENDSASQVPVQDNNSNHTIQESTLVLTIDAFNDIVKG